MTKSHKEKIHKESKFADNNKNLPFEFSKPKKSKPNRDVYQCDKCDRVIPMDASRTCVIVCVCKNFMIVEEARINVVRE